MVAAYPEHLNSQGYFGPMLDLHAINEQQLSGHGWFLRGLCEYYDYQHDPLTLAQIRTVVRNLALPLRGSYAAYPIDPALRGGPAPASPGAVDGHLNGQHGNWTVSSDTGCAFIFIDGLAQAWLVLKAANDPIAPAVKSLLDEAFARFLQADLIAMKAQTHASLTATRALLRVYAETRDLAVLQAAQARYRLYRTTAMTEHYANTNWFGRPDSWTEPCAIIDSFMVATQLWQYTGDPACLEDAHLIWFNGVGRGLRNNGGFGTDTCAGFNTPFVKVRSYEAYFCCTMRGGEGHARAAQYLYFATHTPQGLPEITVAFYSDSLAHIDLPHGRLTLRQSTAYPYAGQTRVQVVSGQSGLPITLHYFAPNWILNPRLTLNGRMLPSSIASGFVSAQTALKTGDVLDFNFDLCVAPQDALNSGGLPGYHSFHSGPLLLGYQPRPDASALAPSLHSPNPAEIHIARNAHLRPAGHRGVYDVVGTDITLAPLNDLNDSAATPRDPCPRQVLFRAG
jgi:uncharacterized protein